MKIQNFTILCQYLSQKGQTQSVIHWDDIQFELINKKQLNTAEISGFLMGLESAGIVKMLNHEKWQLLK
jgi:hypothetical protein